MLYFKEFGSGQPLVVLHGLFGSSDNWQSLARVFAEKYHVFIVDQRNHGRSPHTINTFNYALMSDDLNQFLSDHDLTNVILLGHSMGGKSVMQYVMDYGNERVDRLIVADIGPKQYPLHHDTILEALTTANFDVLKTRKEVDQHVSKFIDQLGVRQFLLKNLYWIEKTKLAWRFNVDILSRDIANIVDAVDGDAVDIKTLFIRGASSNYILDEDLLDILELFPNAKFDTIDGVGHWLHAEAPEIFIKKVHEFIEN
ncbi:MAG: esterase [Flavobacteriales bacterium]|jgi:esterase